MLPISKGLKLAIIGANAETKTLMAGGTGGGLLSATVVCKCATSRAATRKITFGPFLTHFSSSAPPRTCRVVYSAQCPCGGTDAGWCLESDSMFHPILFIYLFTTSGTDWCCLDSPADAINASNTAGSVSVSPGASIHGTGAVDQLAIDEAVIAAKTAEAVVFVIGGDWTLEHEGSDRSSIGMPGLQAEMLRRVAAAVGPKVPLVAVLVHGGRCVDLVIFLIFFCF